MDIDLGQFFDTVHHDKLMRIISHTIKEELTYASEKGFINELGYVATERYDIDAVENKQKKVSDIMDDSMNMLLQMLSDFLVTVEAKINKLIEVGENFGKVIIELPKNTWNVVSVGITKISIFFSSTIQTDNGEAIIVSELFLNSLKDANAESVQQNGRRLYPISNNICR